MNQLNTKAVDTRPWAVCADVKSPARGGAWRGMLMPKVRTGRALAGSRRPPPPRKTPVPLLAWPLQSPAQKLAAVALDESGSERVRISTDSCWVLALDDATAFADTKSPHRSEGLQVIKIMEAGAGIEPAYGDLQSPA